MNYFCKAFDDDDRLCMTESVVAETPEDAALRMAEILEEDPESYSGDPTTPWWRVTVRITSIAPRASQSFRVTRVRTVTHKVEVFGAPT